MCTVEFNEYALKVAFDPCVECALDLKRKLPGLNLVNVLSLDPTGNLFNAAT